MKISLHIEQFLREIGSIKRAREARRSRKKRARLRIARARARSPEKLFKMYAFRRGSRLNYTFKRLGPARIMGEPGRRRFDSNPFELGRVIITSGRAPRA